MGEIAIVVLAHRNATAKPRSPRRGREERTVGSCLRVSASPVSPLRGPSRSLCVPSRSHCHAWPPGLRPLRFARCHGPLPLLPPPRDRQTDRGPGGLAGVAEALAVGREQVASRDEPDQPAGPAALDDGEAADVVVDHVVGGVAQGRVVVADDRRASEEVAQRGGRPGSIRSSSSRRVTTPPRAPASSTTGKPWWAIPPSAGAIHVRTSPSVWSARSETTSRVAASRTSTCSRKSAAYSAGTRTPRRAIFSVMIELRISSARDQERRRAAAQQRQQSQRLQRRLEREHDRREQRPRRAGEDRRHADQRGDAQVDAGVREEPLRRATPSSSAQRRRRS